MPSNRPHLTREAVLSAARVLLAEEGLAAVSLRRLAKQLGVTAPALYGHVESKGDLLRALAEDEFGRLIEQLHAIDIDDPVERVRANCHAYVDYARDNPALFEVMFVFRPDWSSPARADELPAASKVFAVAAAPIDDAIAAGAMAETDPLLAALTLWSAVHGVASVLLAGPDLGDDYERTLVDSVVDRVLAGFAAPLPRKRARD